MRFQSPPETGIDAEFNRFIAEMDKLNRSADEDKIIFRADPVTGVFQMSGGRLVIEAEHSYQMIPRNGHQ